MESVLCRRCRYLYDIVPSHGEWLRAPAPLGRHSPTIRRGTRVLLGGLYCNRGLVRMPGGIVKLRAALFSGPRRSLAGGDRVGPRYGRGVDLGGRRHYKSPTPITRKWPLWGNTTVHSFVDRVEYLLNALIDWADPDSVGCSKP